MSVQLPTEQLSEFSGVDGTVLFGVGRGIRTRLSNRAVGQACIWTIDIVEI